MIGSILGALSLVEVSWKMGDHHHQRFFTGDVLINLLWYNNIYNNFDLLLLISALKACYMHYLKLFLQLKCSTSVVWSISGRVSVWSLSPKLVRDMLLTASCIYTGCILEILFHFQLLFVDKRNDFIILRDFFLLFRIKIETLKDFRIRS